MEHLFLVSDAEGFFSQTLPLQIHELVERILLAGFKSEDVVLRLAGVVLVTAHDNLNFYEARITGKKQLFSYEWQKSNRHIKEVSSHVNAFLSQNRFTLLSREIFNRNLLKGKHGYDSLSSCVEQEDV